MTTSIGSRFKKYLNPEKDQSGIYSFRREKSGAITRFHLRVEENGSGMLLANSSVACRLSSSGTLIAKSLLEGKNQNEIQSEIRKNFRGIRNEQLDQDIESVREFIETLSTPDDTYPIFNLQDPALEIPRSLMAPFHAQIPAAASEKINPILQKLWDVGIPHVTFHVSDGTSIEEAIQNVQRAEDVGMICGIRAQGTWLQKPDVMKRLALAGIDYIVAPLVSYGPAIHDDIFGPGDYTHALQSFSDCIQWEICPVTEVAVFCDNRKDLPELMQLLESKGVRNIHCFTVAEPLSEGLNSAGIIQSAVDILEAGSNLAMRIIWLPPVSRNTSLQAVAKAGPRTAGDISISVNVDGLVCPPRGSKIQAGNLFSDSWEKIWNADVFRKFRDRVESNTHCSICPGMEVCAADCPGDSAGWDTL